MIAAEMSNWTWVLPAWVLVTVVAIVAVAHIESRRGTK